MVVVEVERAVLAQMVASIRRLLEEIWARSRIVRDLILFLEKLEELVDEIIEAVDGLPEEDKLKILSDVKTVLLKHKIGIISLRDAVDIIALIRKNMRLMYGV